MAMDVVDEIFCIQWNQHHSTIITGLESLLQRDSLIDVQLEAEGKFINAHRLVLSSCSPYFEALLSQPVYKKNKKQTIIYLNDVPFADAAALINFMYKGVVEISKEQMPSFMHTAEILQIKGLKLSDIDGGNKLVTAAPPSITGNLIESSKEILAQVHSELSEVPVSAIESPIPIPSTSSNYNNPSSSAAPCEAIFALREESERDRSEATVEQNEEAVPIDLQVDAWAEKRLDKELVLDINSNIQDTNESINNEMEKNQTSNVTDLGGASQNKALTNCSPKIASVSNPIENASGNSVIAGTSHSPSTRYARSSRKCKTKSSVGLYVEGSAALITTSSEEFKPYMCEKCGRSYLYKGRLDNHKRLACGYISPPKVVDTTSYFPCPKCTYRSAWKGNLNKHIRSQHGD